MNGQGRRAGWRLAPLLAAVAVAMSMTAALGYQIERRASILRNGAEVLLKTVPVDPRDLFRGDYVVLSYDISNVPVGLFTGPQQVESGRVPIWVRLKPGTDGFWTITEASFAALSPGEGSVVLRSLPVHVSHPPSEAVSYSVQYGIESYYVPEGEGLAIEQARDNSQVTVSARISASGEAQIRALLVDGREIYAEPLY